MFRTWKTTGLILVLAGCGTLTTPEVDLSPQATLPLEQYVSLRVTTAGLTNRFLRHAGSLGFTEVVDGGSSELLKQDASWKVVRGLADAGCYSLEARNFPGQYLRHAGSRLRIDPNNNSELFRQDATFCSRPALDGSGNVSLESKNFPGRFIRHRNSEVWLDVNDNSGLFRQDATWAAVGAWSSPGVGGFVVSEAQYNQMFPDRAPYYNYAGFRAALSAWPAFAGTGSDTVRRQEAAAFLANMHHGSGGGRYVRELNQANWNLYCSSGSCGGRQYYGRGPIQLSWDYNYRAAGSALGLDLLNNPDLVADDPAVGWKTALWYWMTQRAQAARTPHDAMVQGAGFGETIRAINGGLECNGAGEAQRNARIGLYRTFTGVLGVPPGDNLGC